MEHFESLCNFLEQETIGTEVVIYGTAGMMLLLAYMKRRPAYLVRQFKKPAHIPAQLINERIMHTGVIKDVQQHGKDTLLFIKHRPLIPIFTSNKELLPIKLPGIQVNHNGFAWLKNCLLERQATFIPLAKADAEQNYVVSQLCLVHPPKGKKLLDISELMLKMRLAQYRQDEAAVAFIAAAKKTATEAAAANKTAVAKILAALAARTQFEQKNVRYYEHLQKIDSNAKLRENWLLWAAKYPLVWYAVSSLREKLLRKQTLLPELVRAA